MLGPSEKREARMKSIVRDTPLCIFGRIEEVAALAVMLASDEVTYMTGAELTVDGGFGRFGSESETELGTHLGRVGPCDLQTSRRAG
jgi:NAD(P)-dependent dehydrogenase (short-subunit alcohol dehydrogenase family)